MHSIPSALAISTAVTSLADISVINDAQMNYNRPVLFVGVPFLELQWIQKCWNPWISGALKSPKVTCTIPVTYRSFLKPRETVHVQPWATQ